MKRFFTAALLLATTVAALAFTGPYTAKEGKLFDGTNTEVRMRGVNRTHWDQNTANQGTISANTVRIVIDFSKPPATMWGVVKSQALAYNQIPIVGNWAGTCKSDPAVLTSIVDTWVAQASTWTQLNQAGLVNIANEWGPSTVVWRDSYITAVQRMRKAGYKGALVIDAANCGQSAASITQYGADVLAADPLKNIVFDVHVYSAFHFPATASWMQDYAGSMKALKASGLTILLGEFGPLNVGPSQTQVPIDRLVSDAEANGFGWLAWAYDDNNLSGCAANDAWFSMTKTCWDPQHLGDGNLTKWGVAVVAQLRAFNQPAPVVVAPAVNPMLVGSTTLWCKPQYSCVIPLTVTSPINSTVLLSLEGNDPRITVNSISKSVGWWANPVAGTYPMTLVMKDTAAHVTRIPVTLIISWCPGKVC
jgi:mannan endo-1,4-beta-mannosidase